MQLFNSSTLRNVDANSINDGVRIVLKNSSAASGSLLPKNYWQLILIATN
jgi:hypothetical protein